MAQIVPIRSRTHPVSKKTLDEFCERIVQAIEHRMSLTYVFPKSFGGARAWLKYLLLTPEAFPRLHEVLKDRHYYYFDSSESLDRSTLGVLFELLSIVDSSRKYIFDELSLQTVKAHLERVFREKINEKGLVIFVGKLNASGISNAELGSIFYSLWKPHQDKFSFILTFPGDLSSFMESVSEFGDFKEIFLQNYHQIKPLADVDILQSIEHWEELFEVKYSDEQKKVIVNQSRGYPYASKLLCQRLKLQPDLTEMECEKICNSVIGFKQENTRLYLDDEFDICLGKRKLSHVFTDKEQEILTLLIKKESVVVSRDDLAKALWGVNYYDKFSDYSIDKYLSELRKKLKSYDFTGEIKTVKGRGFGLFNKI